MEQFLHIVSCETMNKKVYEGVIVVEGATDKLLLESFLDTTIVTTNGSDVPHETIDYIKELAKTHSVVVLTDPDSPGKRIRDILNLEIPGLYHAYIPKEKAIKKNKVGVAESDKETILEALMHACPSPSSSKKGSLSIQDIVDLGLIGNDDSSGKRDIIAKKFHIGHGNGKATLKMLNSLGITKEQLEEALNE